MVNEFITGKAVSEAHWLLCEGANKPAPGGNWLLSDNFGRVLAWLWESGQQFKAADMVAELVAELRNHSPHRTSPRPGFSDLKWGLRSSLPTQFSGEDAKRLMDYLDEIVPDIYGGDIESPDVP